MLMYYELVKPHEIVSGVFYRKKLMILHQPLKEKRADYYSRPRNNKMIMPVFKLWHPLKPTWKHSICLTLPIIFTRNCPFKCLFLSMVHDQSEQHGYIWHSQKTKRSYVKVSVCCQKVVATAEQYFQ